MTIENSQNPLCCNSCDFVWLDNAEPEEIRCPSCNGLDIRWFDLIELIQELQEKADKWDKVAHLFPPTPTGGYADDDKIQPFI